jgi:hypothetical protein
MVVGLGKNDSSTNIIIDAMDWLQTPQGDNLAVEDYPNPYSAKDLLKITPNSFHLEPGESQSVNISADIPEDAKAGGRYAILGVRTSPKAAAGIPTVGIVAAINSLLALNITGAGIRKSGEITSLEIENPTAANQFNVSMIFNNTGNIHYKIRTEFVLADANQNVLANSTILPSTSVLPGASRRQQILLVPAKPLRPAAYTIEANVMLESGEPLATKSISISIES